MKHKLREYGLSITLLGLFLVFQVGLSLVGQRQYNHEQAGHGQPAISYFEYVRGPAFLEATMENWESEFLQMFAYVLLTAFLFQKGSAESKDPQKQEAVDRDPRQSRGDKNAPWPVRKGGFVLKLYENSLSIALFLLFVVTFVLHALGGTKVQPAANRPRRTGGYGRAVLGNRAVLVRILAKLAKRVFFDWRPGAAEHLSAPEGIT